MRNLRALLPFLLSALALTVASPATSKPWTWLEHREAAKAGLRYRIADPVTPVQHLERALNLARSEGASPSEIGNLMDLLANANASYGCSLEKREELLLAALRFKEANLGENSLELVPTLRELSTVRLLQQRNLDSLQVMARALSIQIRHFGAESAQAAEGYSMLGTTFDAVGDVQQAETLVRKSVGIVRRVPNPPDEIASAVLSIASGFLGAKGYKDESEALQQEVAPFMARVVQREQQEAKNFANLPQIPYPSDVNTLNDQEMAAMVAAGLALVEPAKPLP